MVRPPSWVGQRLLDLAVNRWPEFHGTILLRTGTEPLQLPLPSLLDLIYAWWIDGATEKDTAKFHQQLHTPPAGADLEDREEWADEDTDDAFERALHGVRGRGRGHAT